jgi:rubrerythrin
MELNKIEVFKIAQNLEKQGIEFYKKSAEFTDEQELKTLFDELAAMEIKHLALFRGLEEKFKDDAYLDSDDIGKYLDEQYHSSLFDQEESVDEWKDISSVKDIFKNARSKEVFSVQFYSFIHGQAKSGETKSALEKVIAEEKEHVALMDKYLSQLGG